MIAPDVQSVETRDGYVVRVVFADGQVRDVDIEPLLDGPIFAPLRERARFEEAYADEETGTVAWPNGADIDPDVIYAAGALGGRVRVSIPRQA